MDKYRRPRLSLENRSKLLNMLERYFLNLTPREREQRWERCKELVLTSRITLRLSTASGSGHCYPEKITNEAIKEIFNKLRERVIENE